MEQSTNEKKPPQGRLGWFDRLLLKVAIAKALARHGECIDSAASDAARAIRDINQA